MSDHSSETSFLLYGRRHAFGVVVGRRSEVAERVRRCRRVRGLLRLVPRGRVLRRRRLVSDRILIRDRVLRRPIRGRVLRRPVSGRVLRRLIRGRVLRRLIRDRVLRRLVLRHVRRRVRRPVVVRQRRVDVGLDHARRQIIIVARLVRLHRHVVGHGRRAGWGRLDGSAVVRVTLFLLAEVLSFVVGHGSRHRDNRAKDHLKRVKVRSAFSSIPLYTPPISLRSQDRPPRPELE